MFSSSTKLERGVEKVARKIGIDPKVASKTWNTMSTYTKNVAGNFSQTRSKLMKRSNTETPDKYLYQRAPSHSKININQNTSNIHQNNQTSLIKYAFCCLIFFACILLLNFIFTKHLTQYNNTKTLPNDDLYVHVINPTHHNNNTHNENTNPMHINYDEGLPALLDNIHDTNTDKDQSNDHEQELDQLFAKINNNNESTITANEDQYHENPMLEENSMKSLRDNIINAEHIKQDTNIIETHDELDEPMLDWVDSKSKEIMDLKQHQYDAYPMGLSDIQNGIYYLAMIADMDKASKHDKYKWRSYMQHVKLILKKVDTKFDISVEWILPPFEYDEHIKLITYDNDRLQVHNETCCYTVIIDGYFSEKGRGMELSELISFNNVLYAFDDRSGIIYEITRQFEAIPRHIIMEGDGNIAKGMKIEWATYKPDEELLYIGSIGREYTNSDGTKIRKLGLLWVVTLDKNGVIKHHDWTDKYMKIREVTGTLFPGYLWIEAIEWSDVHRKWFIAPRYFSFEKYDSKLTENRGCNLLIVAAEDFSNIELVWINFKSTKRELLEDGLRGKGYRSVNDLNAGQLRSMSVKQENIKTYLQYSNKGFSAIRFLPNTNDTIIIAIRTQENEKDILNSFLSIFDIGGNVYLRSKRIPLRKKYEGLVVL